MVFGSEDVLPLYGFLKTNIMLVTNMKDYLTLDDNDHDADFRYKYRDTMIAQFTQGLHNKNISLQDQGESDENDTLRKRNKFWFNVIDVGGPISDDVYDYDYNEPGMEIICSRGEIFSSD